jgi:hypothetical protein
LSRVAVPELALKVHLSLKLSDEHGLADSVDSVCSIELAASPSIENLGLALCDGKAVLSWLQACVVSHQIKAREQRQRVCPCCGTARALKDYHPVRYRSVFGGVAARVARWRACSDCKAGEITSAARGCWISAELLYVHSRLAATLPYARATEVLELLLPKGAAAVPSTVRAHALASGERLDTEGLSAGIEPQRLSADPVSIGLDGGYVRHCHPERCDRRYRVKGAPDFEVVVGRLLGSGACRRSIAFARTVDPHCDRRVLALLAGAGGDRAVEVFTDGDTLLRSWQEEALPSAIHVLDWYHLRRRVEEIDRVVHRRDTARQLRPRDHDRLSGLADHMQWRLWHGRSDGVLRRLQVMLRVLMRPAVKCRPVATLLGKLIRELHRYLMNNADSLPDYGKRWRSGQRISSAFVESAVNQIIDKRMSKSQQMRWDPLSAHRLLQVRVRHIDGLLRSDFARWYPGFPANDSGAIAVA